MAEEKFLKDEVLNDEELEEVVGGYYDTWQDCENFKKLKANGYGDFYGQSRGQYQREKVEDTFKRIGKTLGINLSAKITYIDPNKYFLDGKEFSRDEFWSIINEGFAANK